MNTEEAQTQLEFDEPRLANALFGPAGENLRRLEEVSGLHIASNGRSLTISGDSAARALAGKLLGQLYALLKKDHPLHPRDIIHAYEMLKKDPNTDLVRIFQDAVFISAPRRSVVPKTLNQRDYVEALRKNELVFGVGPAGTGKTYLAVAVALSMLMNKKVKRLVLTRPAVEAGERLGFLPGDLTQKIDPYLRPLYDAMHDMMDFNKVNEMLESGVIEIAPLAFMRGRTLNNSFIILDEAQNTTREQMKMFLTRLGFGSRMAITGDITQIDLPSTGYGPKAGPKSGLVEALKVLEGIPEIKQIHFNREDVVRHPLVGRIVQAYENQSF